MAGFFVVSVGPKVIRMIAADPDGGLRAKVAVGNTPGAKSTYYAGHLPEEGNGVEDFAADFREQYCEKLADDFLAAHRDTEMPDEPTRVSRPSGLQRKVSLVEN
jgi:hypothetical protein